MKVIILIYLFLNLSNYSSQNIEDSWKQFELNSEWKIKYLKNDKINEKCSNIGELVFFNNNPKEPQFRVSFRVYKYHVDLCSESTEVSKFLKGILLEKSPNVMDKFEFNNNIYVLSLTSELLFRDDFYISLATEIENFIKK